MKNEKCYFSVEMEGIGPANYKVSFLPEMDREERRRFLIRQMKLVTLYLDQAIKTDQIDRMLDIAEKQEKGESEQCPSLM